jgi:hypothetical protein
VYVTSSTEVKYLAVTSRKNLNYLFLLENVTMPFNINYDIEFEPDDGDIMIWDEKEVKRCLPGYTCMFIPVYSYPKFRVILMMDRKHDVQDILDVIFDLFIVDFKYTISYENKWKPYAWIER